MGVLYSLSLDYEKAQCVKTYHKLVRQQGEKKPTKSEAVPMGHSNKEMMCSSSNSYSSVPTPAPPIPQAPIGFEFHFFNTRSDSAGM
jgi:hypothetical protein